VYFLIIASKAVATWMPWELVTLWLTAFLILQRRALIGVPGAMKLNFLITHLAGWSYIWKDSFENLRRRKDSSWNIPTLSPFSDNTMNLAVAIFLKENFYPSHFRDLAQRWWKMEYSEKKRTARINTKIFHRIETCQKCGDYKQNTDLKHIPIWRTLHRICYECYRKIKNNPFEWSLFLKWSG